mgnify:CR=1 FL=1
MKNILKVESPNQAITYPHLVKEIVYQYERFRDAQSQTRFVNLIEKLKYFLNFYIWTYVSHLHIKNIDNYKKNSNESYHYISYSS